MPQTGRRRKILPACQEINRGWSEILRIRSPFIASEPESHSCGCLLNAFKMLAVLDVHMTGSPEPGMR